MGSNWKQIPLGKLISLQRGHDLPSQDRVDGQIPIMGSSGLTGWHNVSKCDGPGVVIGRSGNSMGVVSYSESDFWPLNTCLYVTDFKGNDERYVYYMLQQIDFDQFNSGSAQKSLNRNAVYPYEVTATTDVNEQKRIGKLLANFESKISINNQINQTLEKLVQALFKSWFVDFDPVVDNALDAGFFEQNLELPGELLRRAEARKAARESGNFKPLPEDIRQLFPAAFEECAEPSLGLGGWVPQGWISIAIYSLAEFINGAAYKAFEPNLEKRGLPIIKIAELKAGVTAQTAFSDREMPDKYRLSTGDILFSWSGNPDTSIDTFVWTHGDAWLNQHIFKVTPPDGLGERSFVLTALKSLRPLFAETARNKQTTGLGHVTVADLKRLQIIKPEPNILAVWDSLVSPYVNLSFALTLQAQTLSNLRDTLLPKLISGELSLDETEAELAEEDLS